MQSLKSIFGVLGALVPVVYCGGLIYYFLDTSGSVEDAQTIGLGPTLLGLGVVGLLFSIPLIVKLYWLFIGARSPKRSGRDASTPEAEFDADAVVNRYMAQRSVEAAADSSPTPSALDGGAPPSRPGFGRRIK